MGQVGGEAPVALDDALEGDRFARRQVVLGAAPRARQVDVPGILGPVVLGSPLEVRVADHADLLEHRQGPVHGGRVDGGEAPLHLPGHVLRCDVAVGPKDLLEDGLPLRRDAVPALSEHGHDTSGAHRFEGTAPALQLQKGGGPRIGQGYARRWNCHFSDAPTAGRG